MFNYFQSLSFRIPVLTKDSKDLNSSKCSNPEVYSKSQEFVIDFGSWYVDQEDFLAKFWSSKREIQEEWHIDLNNLDIKNVVANGAYGTVYKGVYNGREVAVKILGYGEDGHTTTAEAFALLQSFYREVAVMQQLDHPNVTKFLGASVGISDLKIPSKENSIKDQEPSPSKACCVVLEYLPGETLRKYLIKNSRNKLTVRSAVKLALDLARGLSYLHSKNIVHHNVTTDNILLDIHGTPKIAGFRLARVEAQNHRDKTGEVGYIAPEVLEGKPYNRKCDVYSFGICLWEIYSCDTPYADLSSSKVSTSVVQKNLRPKISKSCPSSLASIIKKCWDENPVKRPEMKEVVGMLETLDIYRGSRMMPEDEDNDWRWCFTPIIRGSVTSYICTTRV